MTATPTPNTEQNAMARAISPSCPLAATNNQSPKPLFIVGDRVAFSFKHEANKALHDQTYEGWALFEIGHSDLMEIQRDDELAVFASDDEAVDHVKRMAAAGSQRHQEALARHLADSPALARQPQA
ncbi:TPA: hypothetical protein ACQQJB_003648 [Pseudomonas aeruginosa]